MFRRRTTTEAAPRSFASGVQHLAGRLPDDKLARDAVRYVTDGRPTDVLPRLHASHDTQLAFAVATHASLLEPATRTALHGVYAGWAQVPVEARVRWAQLLDAAATGWGRSLAMPPVVGHDWVEVVLGHLESAWLMPAGAPRGRPTPTDPDARLPFGLADLVPVLEGTGVRLGDLLTAALTPGPSRWVSDRVRPTLARFDGFPAAVLAHRDLVTSALTGDADQRVLVMEMLGHLPGAAGDATLAALADVVADQATGTATRVREAATPLLDRTGGAADAPLRRLAVEARPEQRARALELLHDAGGGSRAFAEETAEADRAASVRRLVDTWAVTSTRTQEPETWSLPDREPTVWGGLDRVAAEGLAARLDVEMRTGRDDWEQQMASLARRWPQYAGPSVPGLPRRLRSDLADALRSTDRPRTLDHLDRQPVQVTDPVVAAATDPGLPAAVAVALLALVGDLTPDWRGSLPVRAVRALEQRHAAGGGPDLLHLQWLLDDAGHDGARMIWRALITGWEPLAVGWPDDDVWPFLAANLPLVVEDGTPSPGDHHVDAAALYRLVATFPTPPTAVTDHLYSVALGTARTHRTRAQAALARHPDRAARAVAALGDGRSEVRTIAATWLAGIADPETLPALEKAVAREKHDVAKAALLDALVALGRPVEQYLDLDRLEADARRTVDKGLPAALSWFPWDRVPEVHWASGERVPPEVVQHLVAQAVKAKSAEPHALLRRYAGLMDTADRRALGEVLLASWLAEDLRPIAPADAQREALTQAGWYAGWAAQPGSPYAGLSTQQIAAELLPQLLRKPAGSATTSKGLLAVVAACGGREVVAPAERYLEEWYGHRASQCKALVAMLAWVDDPLATQRVLAVGNRFRTKSIQEEAARQVAALAERQGWTVDELADRTVPTAGFDDHGRLDLPYGPDRRFTAVLLPDLTVALHDPDGKVVKSLPAARRSDEPDTVAASKKSLSAARKDLKAVVAQQRERLYEALCTQRTWAADDWLTHLAGHPLTRLLVTRLVWRAETADGAAVTSFRLLDDGTLTDVDDEPVTLDEGLRVRLAHDTNLPPDQVAAWTTHLADYEVDPLFRQLGQGVHRIPDDQRHQRRLTDLEGHVLSTFALRSRAYKLGWSRGPAEDAGWFTTYRKRFPSLGVIAVLEFTGNPLPETDRPCALLSLSYEKVFPDAAPGARSVSLTLGDVPPVLLSETWQDLRLIAAEGSGFDPDWKRRTEY